MNKCTVKLIIAEENAVFGIDTGDNIINSFRFLDFKGDKKWTISALFATMGYGVPAAIAGQLAYPDRQVFNISGDGAFSMVMQDLLTEVKYNLPVINIVTSNQTLNFIKSEQDDIFEMNHSGIDLVDADYAKIAEGMGVKGITVKTLEELPAAFDEALATTKAGRPVLIDAKITDKRGIPVEELELHVEDGKFVETISAAYQATHAEKTVEDFFVSYDGAELKPLTAYFEEYGVEV